MSKGATASLEAQGDRLIKSNFEGQRSNDPDEERGAVVQATNCETDDSNYIQSLCYMVRMIVEPHKHW
jgi:hypothetical protein